VSPFGDLALVLGNCLTAYGVEDPVPFEAEVEPLDQAHSVHIVTAPLASVEIGPVLPRCSRT
jgi:hypothetical protein